MLDTVCVSICLQNPYQLLLSLFLCKMLNIDMFVYRLVTMTDELLKLEI